MIDLKMGLLALLAALAGIAAYSDIRFRTIPNGLNAATALLGLASVGLTQGAAAAAERHVRHVEAHTFAAGNQTLRHQVPARRRFGRLWPRRGRWPIWPSR